MRQRNFISIFLSSLIFILGCSSSSAVLTPDAGATHASPVQDNQSSHSIWGEWTIDLNPETQTVSLLPNRESQAHLNVTSFLTPPNCPDCLQIQITGWNPVERIVNVRIRLRNPTTLTGYDVKTVISNYDLKEFITPDAYTNLYTDGSTWNPYYVFAFENPDNAFGPGEIHDRNIQLGLPPGASGNAKITIDVSYPNPQEEPWRIDNIYVPGPLQNDMYHFIAVSGHVRDHQGNIESAYLDLSPINGPSSVPMGDDGKHYDFLTGDAVWGLGEIITGAFPGLYDVWMYVKSTGSDILTAQKIKIEVINPPIEKTPLYVVSMMHAEEQPFFLNEATYLPYAQNLRNLKTVFNSHNAKIALQPDWTFIQGTVNFSPTLFAEFQAEGHGIDTHAHESSHDLAAVHDMLDAAGVTGTIVANGGYTQDWNPNLTWAAYVAHFTDGEANQMFYVANAYKWPPTQEVDSLFTPIRPSFVGDWWMHNQSNPLVYIPGAPPNCKQIEGNINLLPAALDLALRRVIPGKINCFYWHDSVHNYGGPPSQARIDLWEATLTDYFDPKVASGDVVWKNFSEIYHLYIDW